MAKIEKKPQDSGIFDTSEVTGSAADNGLDSGHLEAILREVASNGALRSLIPGGKGVRSSADAFLVTDEQLERHHKDYYQAAAALQLPSHTQSVAPTPREVGFIYNFSKEVLEAQLNLLTARLSAPDHWGCLVEHSISPYGLPVDSGNGRNTGSSLFCRQWDLDYGAVLQNYYLLPPDFHFGSSVDVRSLIESLQSFSQEHDIRCLKDCLTGEQISFKEVAIRSEFRTAPKPVIDAAFAGAREAKGEVTSEAAHDTLRAARLKVCEERYRSLIKMDTPLELGLAL
ncbi:MAG: hypothetical protein J5J00_17030 [Deltaproteobacteria bacterium]|nr:hypothetical protein [Deltaproteobacteria bacterium]